MKTYCKPKQVNIEDPEFNRKAVHKSFSKGKLAKNEFARLLTRTGLISRREVAYEHMTQKLDKTDVAIDHICDLYTQKIRERDLCLQPIKQFERMDGLNGKLRTLSKLSAEQQVHEYIAVNALTPLFRAKVYPFQYGSIPGRGQVKGKRKIERILRRKFHCDISEIKGDVRHAYESVSNECVMKLLKRDIGKNRALLWYIGTIIDTYPNKHLIIGGYLPAWLFNYVMSYVLRYILSLEKTRRGVKHKMVLACVCYADDFSIYGKMSNLKRVMRKAQKWAEENLEISIKEAWGISCISSFEDEKSVHDARKLGARKRTQGVDMMGYVVRRTYTIVRGSIFVRVRRMVIRANRIYLRLGYIPHWLAYRLLSYNGWLVNSDSKGFQSRYDVKNLMSLARKEISEYAKIMNAKREVYIHERILFD